MNRAEVCVLIPTYNRRAELVGAIDSVLAQSYDACHALVIDDGSTDGTATMLADRYGSNERVRWLRLEDNRGVAVARNLGLAQARGEYVAFLDSDDRWKSWKLELQVACLARLAGDGVGMIWSDMDAVDADGRLLAEHIMRSVFAGYRWFAETDFLPQSAPLTQLLPGTRDPGEATLVHWGDGYSNFILGNLCQPSTVVLTRERAAAIGPFDETMLCGEDHKYNLNCARAGPVALLDVSAGFYRQGGADQLTTGPRRLDDAENQLRTILPSIAADRERIRVPERTLRYKLAEAYAWAAEENLDLGSAARARRLCGTSLYYRPLKARTWAVLLAASLHPQARERVREAYRGLKRSMRRAH
jgi:hypothetical protein